jgi:hypothetical protein
VARHYVLRVLGAAVEKELLGHVDPARRLEGIERIVLTYPRSRAGGALRRVVKDPDSRVRSRARAAVRQLGLDDVALPDTRVELDPEATVGPRTRGGWNPTGWLFGTHAAAPTREEALAAHGLPELTSSDDVARLCGIDPDDLPRLMRPGAAAGAPYVEFSIPKARGGERVISAPRAPLKRAQRAILAQILARLPVHDACHGFVAGRSTVTNAAPHQRAAVVIKMDLHDFFPSIHFRRVAGLFRTIGYGAEVANLLAALTTHRPVLEDGTAVWPGALPQGAPTSPAIANLVARRLDARLSGLAQRVGAAYTRYADDLTFSFAAEPEIPLGRLCWWIDGICQHEGFVEHAAKRRILRRGNQQQVTGIVVNSGLFVPREARRRFRAILANCRRHGIASQARGREDFADYLRGFAAYVHMVQPELGAKLIDEVNQLIAGEAA